MVKIFGMVDMVIMGDEMNILTVMIGAIVKTVFTVMTVVKEITLM